MNATPDEQLRSDLDRLTPKERECLERWLDHATAKEIALELGISHHAVEKRLKSARYKLGVTTTLDAARRLAGDNAYGRTASQSPELSGSAAGAEPASAGPIAVKTASPDRRRWTLILGVIIMSILFLTALAMSGGLSSTEAKIAEGAQDVRVVNLRGGNRAALDAAFDEAFARRDKSGDGFLDKIELGRDQLRVQQISSDSSAGGEREVKRISDWDSDRDGKVSLAEFRAAMGKLTAHVR